MCLLLLNCVLVKQMYQALIQSGILKPSQQATPMELEPLGGLKRLAESQKEENAVS